MKLGDVAARLGCQLEGPENLEITGVAGMDEAQAGEITFLSNPKYLPKLRTTRAEAIIAGPDVDTLGKPALRASLLGEVLGDARWQPTFVFYMGYPKWTAHASPRRSMESVIL